jgi:hypothetical protein
MNAKTILNDQKHIWESKIVKAFDFMVIGSTSSK